MTQEDWEETRTALRNALSERRATELSGRGKKQAAVAMLLAPGDEVPELLLMERARFENDPWSGNLGFPGGGREEGDRSLRITAERETFEELAVELPSNSLVGQLDDIEGAYLPVRVACFVYALPRKPALTPNEEVARTWWVPLPRLREERRRVRRGLDWGGKKREVEGIDLLGTEGPLLWGITYRLIEQFFSHLPESLLPRFSAPPQARQAENFMEGEREDGV